MKLAWKNSGKLNQTNLILAGFNHLEPLCGCCCEIILMYCSFFFFSSNSHHTTPPHKTNHCMICTYAVHPPTQLYKKNYYTLCTTIADGRTKLCKYYCNYIQITITNYIQKTPIIHITRSILLYKTHSVSILTEKLELKFWDLWNWKFLFFFFVKKQ